MDTGFQRPSVSVPSALRTFVTHSSDDRMSIERRNEFMKTYHNPTLELLTLGRNDILTNSPPAMAGGGDGDHFGDDPGDLFA